MEDVVCERSLPLRPVEAKRTLFALPLWCTRVLEAVRGVGGTSDSSSSPMSESVEREERGLEGERPLKVQVEEADIEDLDGRWRDGVGL